MKFFICYYTVAGSTDNVLLRLNGKIVESARKVLALPLERELSVSTGAFWNNYDVIERESYMYVT